MQEKIYYENLLKSLTKDKPKRVAAVLACRVNSTRLFAKPLQRIGKYTILELLINQIKKSKTISDIVLAISENPGNDVFIDFAKKHRLKFIIGNEKDVLIVAHGNSLRASMIQVGLYRAEEISNIELPTGCPFVISYESGKVINSEYLS